MTVILAIIGFALIILEVFTVSTFLIFIAFGFLAASLVSIISDSYILIATVGVVVTLLSIKLLRSKFTKYAQPNGQVQTSYNELIGKFAIMESDYTANGVDVGQARVSGVDWSVQCATNGSEFTAGERVKIKKIEGARLIIDRED